MTQGAQEFQNFFLQENSAEKAYIVHGVHTQVRYDRKRFQYHLIHLIEDISKCLNDPHSFRTDLVGKDCSALCSSTSLHTFLVVVVVLLLMLLSLISPYRFARCNSYDKKVYYCIHCI